MPKICKEGEFNSARRMWSFRWTMGEPTEHPIVLAELNCTPGYLAGIPGDSPAVLPTYIDAILRAQAARWIAKNIVWC